MITEIEKLNSWSLYGRITGVQGLLLQASGLQRHLSIGSRVKIISRQNELIHAEVIGFKANEVLLMPYQMIEGIGIGCKVYIDCDIQIIHPSHKWLGRVVNAFGDPIDGKGSIEQGAYAYPIKSQPLPAHQRGRVGDKIDLGVRVINSFLPCCKGQRMGVFAGSGVGKSVLLSMFARNAQADISVIGLIGERGREVQEFLEDDLGEEGLKKSIVIVATSDETALMRRQAAYMTLTVSEFFRDQGLDVLCLMDSVTRFAMAQREIGLAGGEPPASKGYTPTVFAELPRLLERAGPGIGSGSITGLFTVLVEGDDHNEPIADAVRGILDGHIVLDRSIAERGCYPAVNVLRSISRTLPHCNSELENNVLRKAREYLSDYGDMEEMIRLGAYKAGSNEQVDQAIAHMPLLENFIKQNKEEYTDLAKGNQMLREIIEGPITPHYEE